MDVKADVVTNADVEIIPCVLMPPSRVRRGRTFASTPLVLHTHGNALCALMIVEECWVYIVFGLNRTHDTTLLLVLTEKLFCVGIPF